MLRDVSTGEAPRLGRRVVVYGGGNTAMDAARTARRLGAEEALIVYRRDRAHMPAHAFEADEALEEGVKIKWLTSIKEIVGADADRRDAWSSTTNGRPQPTGEFETLEADAVVLALGQQADSGFLRKVPGVEFKSDGTVVVGPDMMTGHPGIFAGGDMVPGERTVTAAVGHGKKAARHIDAWLRGSDYRPAARSTRSSTFDMLNLPIYSDAEPVRAAHAAGGGARRRLRRGAWPGLSESRGALRGAALPVLRQLLRMRQLLSPPVPEQAIEKLGPGPALPLSSMTAAPAAPSASSTAPVTRSR